MSNPWVTWLHKDESEEEETLPRGFAAFMPRDKTATPPTDAIFLARKLPSLIPKAKPVYPPKPPFEMPKYSKEVIFPAFLKVATHEAKDKANEAVQNTENAINDLEYINPIPYDDLINEAVNRYISKHKK